MYRTARNGGFTILEILFTLVIVSAIAGFVVPAVSTGLQRHGHQRFLYAVATVSTECWRRAQLDGHVMHLLFDSGDTQAWWEEERIGVRYPTGYRAARKMRWFFDPDTYPVNPPVLLVSSTDTLVVDCLLSETWEERQR